MNIIFRIYKSNKYICNVIRINFAYPKLITIKKI